MGINIGNSLCKFACNSNHNVSAGAINNFDSEIAGPCFRDGVIPKDTEISRVVDSLNDPLVNILKLGIVRIIFISHKR